MQHSERRFRNYRDAILCSLATPHPQLASFHIHVLDSRRQALHQPHPSAVQQDPDQPVNSR
jgi:hypothetical protein